MPRQNIVFAIVAPLILMAIIAAIVVTIGETLLTVHALADEAYHVGAYATDEENQYWGEIAAIYPVVVALCIATLFLLGGAIASRLMPQRKSH